MKPPGWIAAALLLASPAAAQQGTAGTHSPAGQSGQLPAETLTAAPMELALNPRDPAQPADILLIFQVDPGSTGGAVTVAPINALPGVVTVRLEKVGAPLIDLTADGKPTGRVVQRVTLHFEKIPPRLEKTGLLLQAGLGRFARSVELAFSNIVAPPTGATLTIRMNGETRWQVNDRIPLTVIGGSIDVPAVALAAGPFYDSNAKRALAVDFCLAESVTGPCVPSVSIPANTPRPLWLASTGTAASAGSFAGSIKLLSISGIAADQSLTLQVSNPLWRFLGGVALVAGVMMAWLLTVWLPFAQDRWQSLVPFANLLGRIRALEQGPFAVPVPQTRTLLRSLETKLQGSWLRTHWLLPGPVPPRDPASYSAQRLKDHLDAEASRVTAAEKLVAAVHSAGGDRAKCSALDAIAAAAPFPPQRA